MAKCVPTYVQYGEVATDIWQADAITMRDWPVDHADRFRSWPVYRHSPRTQQLLDPTDVIWMMMRRQNGRKRQTEPRDRLLDRAGVPWIDDHGRCSIANHPDVIVIKGRYGEDFFHGDDQ